MTVGQSGTGGFPIGNEFWKQQKQFEPIEKFEPNEIKIFPQKDIPKKIMMDHMVLDPQIVKLETHLDSPMKDRLDKVPESMKNEFTPDMQQAIEGGITVKDFFERYGEEIFGKKNHGV